MDITYVTTAQLAAKWHMKRDTVIARLRACGCTEYRFGLRTIRWDLAEVADYEASVARTAQVAVASSRPKTRVKASRTLGPGGRRQRISTHG